MGLTFSLFQEPWWLSAVTGDRYDEVIVNRGDQLVGRLPFVAGRRGPFKVSIMPAFTHLLGPAVDAGVGKSQTQLVRRLSITRELIDQLPPFAYFKQVLDPSISCGQAIADGLAFQDRGFRVSPQYTFQIDCRSGPAGLWDGMHTKVRQHIRRAEEKCTVVALDDPNHFIHFYVNNIKKSNKVNRTDFSQFPALFSECKARTSGEILSAIGPNGEPAAMVFLVWGHGVMYYLLSTRAPDIGDNGSVSLLLWSAMKRAHQLNLKFDLDGVYTSGTARFLSGFGGEIRVRLIITRAHPFYRALQFAKMTLRSDETPNFT